ncbi:fatty acid--CoA ligase [Paraburkholderia sp.]|uniref:fatty acid--CoA ligase n=1 Tax=Paraburkholderia sp. TaxID=1926495 RepID=UPI003C7CCBF6
MPLKFASSATNAYRYPLLIKHLLATSLPNATDEEIVYRGERRYTYKAFGERVHKLATSLSALGVEEGSTVSIMDWDSHRYLEAYFAIPMMGAVLHTVNVRLSEDQIVYTINHAGAIVLIVHRDFLPLLQHIRSRLTSVREVVLIADSLPLPLDSGPFTAEYEALLDSSRSDFTFVDFDENATATTFYTSGTTGLPKSVAFSHRHLVLHTIAGMAALASAPDGQSFRRGDVYMPMTPMFHVHAWGAPYIATMLGVKQVYPGRYDAASLVSLKAQEGVTYSHCVPTILHMLLTAAEASGTTDRLRGWKMTIGGAPLSMSLARRALASGVDVFAGYGMSETCPSVTVTRVPTVIESKDDEVNLRCKAGVAVPLVYTEIVDEHMNQLPHDGVTKGELVIRAPWLTQGYNGDSRASEGLWAGGYLHTQDIASIDARGYVQVSDRLKDVIKTGGEWVSSLLLENLISLCPDVSEVAVIGEPDSRWGERPIAIVVKATDLDDREMDTRVRAVLANYVSNGTISKYAVPNRILAVDVLPKTSVGKLDKKQLRATVIASSALNT